jgi:outer membrane protein assembly factor BamB
VVYFKPCIADGFVYFGSKDGKFYCLSADEGRKIWEFRAGNWIYSSPCVSDDIVCFGAMIKNSTVLIEKQVRKYGILRQVAGFIQAPLLSMIQSISAVMTETFTL